jgi:hypothetical protein
MLFDWYETGVQIRLYTTQPNVRRMLWFNKFFKAITSDCHELHPQPEHEFRNGHSESHGEKPTRRNGTREINGAVRNRINGCDTHPHRAIAAAGN